MIPHIVQLHNTPRDKHTICPWERRKIGFAMEYVMRDLSLQRAMKSMGISECI